MSNNQRNERLAVSLVDLGRVPSNLRVNLLGGKLYTSKPMYVDDVEVVEFSCDLLTAAIVCATLRSNDMEHGDPPTRLYICSSTTWGRVANNMVLTAVVDGKVKLNPAVFPDQIGMGKPPPVRVPKIGVK